MMDAQEAWATLGLIEGQHHRFLLPEVRNLYLPDFLRMCVLPFKRAAPA